MGDAHTTPADRERIGQHIRQAVSLVKLDRHPEAEKTLLQAQDLHPQNFDLFGTGCNAGGMNYLRIVQALRLIFFMVQNDFQPVCFLQGRRRNLASLGSGGQDRFSEDTDSGAVQGAFGPHATLHQQVCG